jgi:hypothetical protein
MRRLTLLEKEVLKRLRIILEVNLSPGLNQHIGNVLIRERLESMILRESYKEEEKRPYLLINELNCFDYYFN